MSISYAKPLPLDSSMHPMQEYPAPYLALKEDVSENNVTSSLITLTDNTTVIEVSTTNGPAAIKWIATGNTNPSVVTAAGATADLDHTIPSNSFRRFVVPIESYGVTSIVGANKRNGLYNRVAVKTFGVSSVATIQF